VICRIAASQVIINPGGPQPAIVPVDLEAASTEDCLAMAASINDTFGKLDGRTRVAQPRRIRYTTYSPRFGGTHWVRIEQLERWGRAARIEGTITG